MRRDLTAPIAA